MGDLNQSHCPTTWMPSTMDQSPLVLLHSLSRLYLTLVQATSGCQARNATSPTLPACSTTSTMLAGLPHTRQMAQSLRLDMDQEVCQDFCQLTLFHLVELISRTRLLQRQCLNQVWPSSLPSLMVFLAWATQLLLWMVWFLHSITC